VKVLFHHRQTQAGVISDLLVAPPFADQSRNFLFPPGEPDEMGQMSACRSSALSKVAPQIFALDEKMRLRHTD